MFFYSNYNKPGKGVNKRDPNQPRITTFFEILPRKLWDLCKVNMLYMIAAIPFFLFTIIITGVISSRISNFFYVSLGDPSLEPTFALIDIGLRVIISLLFTIFYGLGPATAGTTYIIRNYGREEHCWLVSDFFEKFRTNFKQSFCIWAIDLAALFLLTIAIEFYMNSEIYILAFIVIFAALVYTIMHLYIYQIMITFDLSLKHILKNSLIFALAKAPKNILLLLISVLVHIVIPVAVVVITQSVIAALVIVLLELLILPSLTSFMSNFFIYSDIEQYIKLALESEHQD